MRTTDQQLSKSGRIDPMVIKTVVTYVQEYRTEKIDWRVGGNEGALARIKGRVEAIQRSSDYTDASERQFPRTIRVLLTGIR